MSRALLDSLELPNWLILAGILLLIAGVIGLVINRKTLQKVDIPNENSVVGQAGASRLLPLRRRNGAMGTTLPDQGRAAPRSLLLLEKPTGPGSAQVAGAIFRVRIFGVSLFCLPKKARNAWPDAR
jgi:hypothetical protein